MLHVDMPSLQEFKALNTVRADACVSIYLPTTPLTQHMDQAITEFGNLAKSAHDQLAAEGFDKRRLALIGEQLDDLAEDDEFWRMQAHSLAILVTPDSLRTFRLANRLNAGVHVSDRFHLKPLARALTVPQSAYVLALSQNHARVIEVFADLAPEVVKVEGMPQDAASAAGKASINDRSASRRITGSEGKKVRLAQYARMVDAALRPLLKGTDMPLILAAGEPLSAIFRSVNSHANLLPDTISASTDRTTDLELAAAARPLLDAAAARDLAALLDLFDERGSAGRTTTDLAAAARAATFGAVDVLMVDMDAETPGRVDEATGAIEFAAGPGAESYGIEDEIMGRALAHGARVLSLRKADMPGGVALAAILRFAS